MATGTLFIVATPIGNLEDITLRALRTLREADVIACEDTRTTGKLLSKYEIKKPLTSYHEHNEETKTPELIERLKSGESVALVTDAGTPGVSDPGYRLVRAAIEAKIPITPVPGATALITALAASGLSTHRFAFFGFMERGEKKKREFLISIRNYPETLIFYESPQRAISTLKAIEEALGDRDAALSRELTKIHEETIRGTISEIIEGLSQREKIKGEVTILIRGAEGGAEKHSTHSLRRLLQEKRGLGKTLKDAVGEVCEETSAKKNVVYGLALELWKE